MSTVQLDIFQSRSNRDEGIAKAAAHADEVQPEWSAKAFQFLLEYLQDHSGTFMAEDVRKAAEAAGIAAPLSERAWGGVFQQAARKTLIKRHGYAQVKNAKAHCANATVWMRA